MIELVQPLSEEDWRRARRLVEAYAASLDVDLSFQNFDHELEHFESEYGPPAGAFLLAEEDGVSLGCIGLRRFSEGVGEIKRLYVSPAARGRRLGRLLAESVVALARPLGFTRLVLDTLPSMQEAQALYRSLGFRPIPPYRFNPVPGTAFLELDLQEPERRLTALRGGLTVVPDNHHHFSGRGIEMARYTGTSDNSDINEALRLAIEAAREGLGANMVVWTLLVVQGANGGVAGQNDLTVEIEASVP
jgi:ribosomal protein S18 acetylase RimI-like enzyme